MMKASIRRSIPGHGNRTAKILDDMESYYNKLMDGVGPVGEAGKILDEIKRN
jgi:hypothetical protein